MTEPRFSDRAERGRHTLREMGNDPDALARYRDLDPVVGPEVERMLNEFCFGDVWSRDGLDKRTRRIVTLVTIATQSRPTYLKTHIRNALQQGLERREIMEVFVHMIAYAGFPTGLSALDVCKELFAELDAAAAPAG